MISRCGTRPCVWIGWCALGFKPNGAVLVIYLRRRHIVCGRVWFCNQHSPDLSCWVARALMRRIHVVSKEPHTFVRTG